MSSNIDPSFQHIANADLDVLLKQLTIDEKVALLTGIYALTNPFFVHVRCLTPLCSRLR